MLFLPYYIGQSKAQGQPTFRKAEGYLLLEDAACYMQRSMDSERCDSLEVILQSVANTQNILCKKKSIKKDKGEFFKGHDVLEKFNLKFFASLCLSLHKSALRKDQVRNQQEDSCLQVRKRVFIRS